MEEQAIRTLDNLQAILEEAGAKLSDVVKVTVFLEEGAGFGSYNDIYSSRTLQGLLLIRIWVSWFKLT